MTERAANPTHYHLRVRIPGWLLASLLLVPAVFLGWKFADDQFDRADPDFQMPTRLTVVDRTVTDTAITIRVLIETNDDFDPLALRYTVFVERPDGSMEPLPGSAAVLGHGGREGRSAVVQVDQHLPEGAEFVYLEIAGPTWSSSVDLADPRFAPRSSVEMWGDSAE
jgi:hypothetical protein